MIDIPAALRYLNNLWVEQVDNCRGKPLPPDDGRIVGGFKEATSIPIFYQNDNTLARLVMRRYNPARAANLDQGLLNIRWDPDFETGTAYFADDGVGWADPRWCILSGDVEHHTPSSEWLPDYLRYADLVGLEYIYRDVLPSTEFPSKDLCYGILSKMYGLIIPGFMNDMATPKEACTMYKLLLYGMCSLRHGKYAMVKELLDTVSQFQLTYDNETTLRNWREDELGGIKTEYIPDIWEGQYPQLLVLANCETTSLAILLQADYNNAMATNALMTTVGLGSAAFGTYSLAEPLSKKR